MTRRMRLLPGPSAAAHCSARRSCFATCMTAAELPISNVPACQEHSTWLHTKRPKALYMERAGDQRCQTCPRAMPCSQGHLNAPDWRRLPRYIRLPSHPRLQLPAPAPAPQIHRLAQADRLATACIIAPAMGANFVVIATRQARCQLWLQNDTIAAWCNAMAPDGRAVAVIAADQENDLVHSSGHLCSTCCSECSTAAACGWPGSFAASAPATVSAASQSPSLSDTPSKPCSR